MAGRVRRSIDEGHNETNHGMNRRALVSSCVYAINNVEQVLGANNLAKTVDMV